MNRYERRQQAKRERRQAAFRMQMASEEKPDFSEVPNGTLCQSIQMLINELRGRGYPMYDYDHKERSLQQIQILGDRIYFLAAPEEGNADEKAAAETDEGI